MPHSIANSLDEIKIGSLLDTLVVLASGVAMMNKRFSSSDIALKHSTTDFVKQPSLLGSVSLHLGSFPYTILLNKNKRSIIILCYQYLLVALYLAFVAFKLGVCSFMTGFNLAFVALYLAFVAF